MAFKKIQKEPGEGKGASYAQGLRGNVDQPAPSPEAASANPRLSSLRGRQRGKTKEGREIAGRKMPVNL